MASVLVAAPGCDGSATSESNPDVQNAPTRAGAWEIDLPDCADWTDRGEAFSRGSSGEWDHYLYGGFAGTMVKKNGTLFVYYQGARDYDERYGTVTDRAIGLATSTDGVSFVKHPQNPVIRWSPFSGHEEGAVSAGAALDESGNIVLMYGANTRETDWLVNADGRTALSADGLTFRDAGVILDHRDSSLWGSGDELFPIIGFRDGNRTYVYYIPNGTPQQGQLGVAWMQDAGPVGSGAVLEGGTAVRAWGMGGYARIGPGTYALFLNDTADPRLQIRTVHIDHPQSVSAPVQSCAFDDFLQGTVYLDRDTGTWYLVHRTSDSSAYRVKVAPARAP